MAIHILVVDDDDTLREVVSAMLEGEGRIIDTAASGTDCLAFIEERRPDLLLLDLTMPGLSGFEVIDRLNDHPRPPAVVAMSGMDLHSSDLFAVRPFVYGFLSKPFNQDQLMKTCLRALEAAQASGGSQQEFKDRRAEPRRSIVMPAALLTHDGTPAAQGQILNLSARGAQLDLGGSLNPGMKLALAFEIPGAQGPFRITARVQWKKDGKLGLSFVDVSDEDQHRLAEVLTSP